jgi:hypothetical protein
MARRAPFLALLLALALTACGEAAQESSAPQRPAASVNTTTTSKENCKPAGQHGDETLFRCWPSGEHGRFVFVAGESDRPITVEPPDQVGHWAWARLSPDGRTILAQWSAECEVPVAYFVPASGGRPREAAPAYSSVAVRWTRDGRAVVEVVESECGTESTKPGFYVVEPDGGIQGPFERPPR